MSSRDPSRNSWSDTVIWWQVYPLGATGAPAAALPEGAPAQPRLRRLLPWVTYLVELGCNGLLLGPVFASQTHGYDTVDYLRVDPRLGTDADLLALVGACHDAGVRVALDGVFNHVGRGFPAFADVLEKGRQSPYASWFRLHDDPEAPDGFGYDCFEGHSGLVELDHTEPAVADHVAAVMEHWLERGVDGWRLDAAYAVPLPFWRAVSDRVRARFPEVWLLGEVIHGDYPSFVAEGGLDSVTQYELWKGTWSALNDGNLFELAHALERHAGFAEAFVPQTFVGNHDVTRIASRLEDPRDVGLAVAVLMTVPGVPSVYYGDEQGFTGFKEDRVHGDDAVRPPLPVTPAELLPFGAPVQALHRELIGVRRRNPWLVRGRLEVLDRANTRLSYALTRPDGPERLVVLLNGGDAAEVFAAPAGAESVGAGSVEAGSVERLASSEPGGDPWTVPPHGWTVLRA